MDQIDIIAEAYRLLQSQENPLDTNAASVELRCEICGSQNTRLVSGGKYRCLMCGFLPS